MMPPLGKEETLAHVETKTGLVVQMTRKGRDGRGVALKNITMVIEYVLETKKLALVVELPQILLPRNILIREDTFKPGLIRRLAGCLKDKSDFLLSNLICLLAF